MRFGVSARVAGRKEKNAMDPKESVTSEVPGGVSIYTPAPAEQVAAAADDVARGSRDIPAAVDVLPAEEEDAEEEEPIYAPARVRATCAAPDDVDSDACVDDRRREWFEVVIACLRDGQSLSYAENTADRVLELADERFA